MILATMIDIATVAGPTVVGYFGLRFVDKKMEHPSSSKKELAGPNLVDGRSQTEWYELIRGMGKEDYERLSLAPLDGLERANDFTWDIKPLMGGFYYNQLMREWYPEQYCKYCDARGCKQTCWEYEEYKEREAEKARKEARRARERERAAAEAERKEADRKAAEEAKVKRDAEYRETLAKALAERGKKREVVDARYYSFDQQIKDMERTMTKLEKSFGVNTSIPKPGNARRVVDTLYTKNTVFTVTDDGRPGVYTVIAERNGVTVTRTITKASYAYGMDRVQEVMIQDLDRTSYPKKKSYYLD